MNSKSNPNTQLLLALKPYLKKNKKEKLDQYIKLMNLTSIMEVLNNNEGDKKNDLSQQEWGIEEKNSSLDLLRNNIIIPYCRNNPDKAGNILNKFNNLFQDMGYSCSMEDVKEDKKM